MAISIGIMVGHATVNLPSISIPSIYNGTRHAYVAAVVTYTRTIEAKTTSFNVRPSGTPTDLARVDHMGCNLIDRCWWCACRYGNVTGVKCHVATLNTLCHQCTEGCKILGQAYRYHGLE